MRRIVEKAYPPHLAESWDKVGLICGDPSAPVTHVACALDCTDAVADAAIAAGAQMLVVHHPLLLKGVTSVAADTPKGRVLHTLITNGVALFAAHTNADAARPGVNDVLAELIGVTPGKPISPTPSQPLDKWGIAVPAGAVEQVKQAVFAAGAGAIGNYSQCSFEITGKGQFLPGPESHPAEGRVGKLETVTETRLEFIAPTAVRSRIAEAMRTAHPYEEVAHDVVPLPVTVPEDQQTGIGRVGTLVQPMRFADFVQQVADRLPETEWGVRAAGDPDTMIETVAVSSGSGDSFLDTVRRLGVDAYVTSDLRHHPVDEYLRAGGPCVVDTAHWASESPWCRQVAGIVADAAGVRTTVVDVRTDPWTISAHKS
ncbi:Nif3-like dinuclear metal center hexameric protein [Corynebacterium sp. CCM 8862]|uniref:GTP cyclohydrolase 1 type 2 homolog n=1 Tax=Corynebacterium mendelii TaxID=2765362 RepID=A0A939DXG9_9CORY|nr:Nif3-like dinuclear metal center hexameric protein [Corynebacterium mendelii]